MTPITHRESAKIIAFPRRRSGDPDMRGSDPTGVDTRFLPATNVDAGSAWYHQAAMQGERTKKL